ncbi:MAG: DUF1178 family protein [Betaproteobacteria bacterium]|nr:DUF1178 family protein [Betaproteobacteria bacterium]
MIVFELICPKQHRFEGWFSSSVDFESQKGRGMLSCPSCGHAEIKKLPTAKIRKSESAGAVRPAEVPVNTQGGRQVPVATMPQVTLNQLIDYVMANTEDVGKEFAEQARRIHREEVPYRNIRGVASAEETEALIDEGVPVMPLPVPPKGDWH